MFLIAGLGNPTMQYKNTRHNAGFSALDNIASEHGIRVKKVESGALTGTGVISGQKVLLVKPQTYMNESGRAIGALASYYKLDPVSDIIILYDDISLPPGMIRVRKQGSAGGHNGIKSIISHLGTQDFMRVRLGVGDIEDHSEMVSHVLGHFSRAEKKLMSEAYDKTLGAVELMVAGDVDTAMNRYNTKERG
jgi:PTH1 family peptidyl-tRNA hydrolase